MSEYEIDEAARQGRTGIAGQAARYLQAYKNVVNCHSDGWSHWRPGYRAADKLRAFVQSRSSDETAFRLALRPIKSICTRKGLTPPSLEST